MRYQGLRAIALRDVEWRRVSANRNYEVSSLGEVRRGSRVLKATPDRYGYCRVKLYYAGLFQRLKVHRLICETFHGPPPSPVHEACHIDGDKSNNAAANLRWGTKSENALDGARHGTLKVPSHNMPGEQHPQAKLTTAQVDDIRRRCAAGEEQKSIAADYGVHPSAVSRIKRGNQSKSRSPHSAHLNSASNTRVGVFMV